MGNRALAFLLVFLPATAFAQDKEASLAEAGRLREAGVRQFEKKDFPAAIKSYEAAIATYETAHGKADRAFLSEAAVLRRAITWCRVHSKAYGRLESDVRAFYDVAFRLGGVAREEGEIRNCVVQALKDLAHQKSMKQLDAVFEAYTGVLDDFIRKAKRVRKQPKSLAPFVTRMEDHVGYTMENRMRLLLAAGGEAKGRKAYTSVLRYWKNRNNRLMAAWTSHNAFYNTTLADRPSLADFYLVETLAAVKKDNFFQVQVNLSVNLKNFLLQLEQQKRWKEGIDFLESVVTGLASRRAFTEDLPQAYFRSCLGRFLLHGEAWEKLASNGDALAKRGRVRTYPYLEAHGALMAGRGLLEAGRNEDAIKRLDVAVSRSDEAGDIIGGSEARLLKSRALVGLERYDEADTVVREALAGFKRVRHYVGVTDARKAGLAAARAANDTTRVAEYEQALRSVSAQGGTGGVTKGEMQPKALVERLRKLQEPTDLLEVSRAGDRLVFKNLLDGKTVELELSHRFRHVNVSGVLFQTRGAEMLLVDIYNGWNSPATEGEIAVSVGGVVSHTGSEFNAFQMRHFVSEGIKLRVSNSVLLRQVK